MRLHDLHLRHLSRVIKDVLKINWDDRSTGRFTVREQLRPNVTMSLCPII